MRQSLRSLLGQSGRHLPSQTGWIGRNDPVRTMVGMAFVRILVRDRYHTDGGMGETRMGMEDQRRDPVRAAQHRACTVAGRRPRCSRELATRDSVSWPRRSSPRGTWRLLGRSRRAHVWRRFVPIISFDDALVLYALLTLFGRHGEAAWRGQDDTGRTRAAFRAGGRQVAFRHRSQLCERSALLAHIFVRRHRPPTSGQNASLRRTSPSRLWKLYQLTAGL